MTRHDPRNPGLSRLSLFPYLNSPQLIAHPLVALVGFALVGVGFANVVPVLFSAAAQVPGTAPAQGIAQVASLGYLGFMTGPPVIGFLAHATSLTAGLSLVVVFATILALAAPRALRPR